MKKKKILIFLFIFVFIFSLPIMAEENKENPHEIVKEFILKVYDKYQQNKFAEVYEFMHPDIKEVLEKENYLSFQNENTEKYNLKISEVEVLEVQKIEEWPEAFQEIIKEKEKESLYEIKMKYKTNYQSGGNENEKMIEKKTYVVRYQEKTYLLWDPNIIK